MPATKNLKHIRRELNDAYKNRKFIYMQAKVNHAMVTQSRRKTKQRGQGKWEGLKPQIRTKQVESEAYEKDDHPFVYIKGKCIEAQEPVQLPDDVPVFELNINTSFLTRLQLENKQLSELKPIADEYGISTMRMTRDKLIEKILEKQANPQL